MNALAKEQTIGRASAVIHQERMRRRSKYIPKLAPLWAKFAGSGSDTMDIDGTISFIQSLGVALEDEVVLAVAYELGAPGVGLFKRAEWLDGWGRLGCDSLAKMQAKVAQLASRMKDDKQYFERVYRFVFRYNLERGHRFLSLDTAKAYWELLLVPRFPEITPAWISFMDSTGKAVSSDNWNMTLPFLEYTKTDPGFERYDETAAWPAVMDDFVDSARAA